MTFGADEVLEMHRPTALYASPSSKPHVHEYPSREIRGPVTPMVLLAYGITANILFWTGLLAPYNANTSPEVVYLHAFVMALGLAMGFGATLATLMIDADKKSSPLCGLDYFAGCLNVAVLGAGVVVVLSTLLRAT